MAYRCNNSSCSLCISQAQFPLEMDCPVCGQRLSRAAKIDATAQVLLDKLPYVIAYPLREALMEGNPLRRINLLRDAFLNYLKYLGLLSAAEFINGPFKNKSIVALFRKNLDQPSFGTWNRFTRECLAYLEGQGHRFFIPELNTYYELVQTGKRKKLYTGEIEYLDYAGQLAYRMQNVTAIDMLINFRNRYLAHAQTPSDEESEKLWMENYPIFRSLLEKMTFCRDYPMLKLEGQEAWLLEGPEIIHVELATDKEIDLWVQNSVGHKMSLLPFLIKPGDVGLAPGDKAKVLVYESYTGRTMKFYSPEGVTRETSGRMLKKMNRLLLEKQKETPITPEAFTREILISRIADENKLVIDGLKNESKLIPGTYQQREEMETSLREWIGARAGIFFLAAESGSGKTNLLVHIQEEYAQRKLPALLIRASRMVKTSLRDELFYLLNIDPAYELTAYTSMAGTQEEPVFLLIDGLNESNRAESIWEEIREISREFASGSIKFVVSCRINSSADLERFVLEEEYPDYLYGQKKENESGLAAYVFWLTPMNIKEMESTWNALRTLPKSRYKPLFSFSDIAEFDRRLYDLLSNPLVLRLFMETYHGRALPKKGPRMLDVWSDWLETYTEQDKQFLCLLADRVWEEGDNELLLDDLLKDEKLGPFFSTDMINAPYPSLRERGWISRHVRHPDVCVSISVEGLLIYLLGIRLLRVNSARKTESFSRMYKKATKLQKSALEAYLGLLAKQGDMGLMCELIDGGDEEMINISTNPLLVFIKSFGSEQTVAQLMAYPTINDWKAAKELVTHLDDLQLHQQKREFLEHLIPHNLLDSTAAISVALEAVRVFDKNEAQPLYEKIDKESDLVEEDADLLFSLGECEHRFGSFTKALEYHEKSLGVRLKVLGEDHPDVAASNNIIGLIWRSLGEYDKALDYFGNSLKIRLKAFGEDHRDVATSYNNIGLIYADKGDYHKALQYYEKTLEIRLKTDGLYHCYTAISYGNIGHSLEETARIDKALEFYYKSLELRIKTLGPEHLDVGISYSLIGAVLNNMGEFDKALEYYNKSLKIQIKTLGAEHPVLARSYNNLGLVNSSKGEYDKAIEYYEKSLEIDVRTRGSQHPNIAAPLNNIGHVYASKGEHDKAIEYYEKSIKIGLEALGAEHPSVAKIYKSLGKAYIDKGEYDKAMEYYEKILEIDLKILGEKHTDIDVTYCCIGRVYDGKGEYDKALEYYEKSLEIQIKTHGAEHPDSAQTCYRTGCIYDGKGEYDKAIKYYEKSLEINLKKLGEEHADLATTYYSIGHAYDGKCDYDKAIEYYERGLNIDLKMLSEEHTDVAYSYFELGRVYMKKNDYKEAIKNLELAYKIEKAGGIAYQIARCHEALNDKPLAFEFYLQAAEIRKNDLGLADDRTIEAIENACRLANELGKTCELPTWINK